MAFSELNVHRALQPWRVAGLGRWLCEDEDHAQLVRDSKKPKNPSGTAAATATHSRLQTLQSSQAPQTSQAHAPTTARSPAHRPPEASAPAARSAELEPPAECAACIRPVEDWPESWRDLLKRSPQPVAGRRARIVWSYAALSDDYGGRANPARRAMLQQLLRDLALPAGSHGFWPLTPPPYDSPAGDPAPDFFHSGIAALNPSVVVLFGAVSPALRLPTLVPLVPDMVLGRSFVRVQDVEALSAPFVTPTAGGHAPHLALVQFLKSQFSALFIA